MTVIGEALLRVRPETAGFESEVTSKLGGAFRRVAGIATGIFAGVAVGSFLKGAIAEAQEAAKVSAQTAAVIKSTGGAAAISAGQVGALADRLSGLAGVDDEMVQTGENVLLTFTNIRNAAGKGNDIFNQASLAALNLARSPLGNGDMAASAVQLGKALNDPIRGVTALQRVGVSFTDQQKKQIETMVKAGDTLGAQKVILAELNKEFGGTAAAQATPLEKLKVAWENLKEEVGTRVLAALNPVVSLLAAKLPGAIDAVERALGPVIAQVKYFGSILVNAFQAGDTFGLTGSDGLEGKFAVVGKALREVADFIRINLQPILIGAAAAFLLLTSPITAVVAALVLLYARFDGVRTVVNAVVSFLTGTVVPAIAAFVGLVSTQFGNLVAYVQQIWPQVSEAIGHAIAVVQALLFPFIAAVVIAWRVFGDDILGIVRTAWTYVQATIQNALSIIENIIRLVLAIINGDWGRAWAALQAIVGAFVAQIQAVLRAGLGLLRGIFSAAFDGAKAAVVTSVGALLSFVASIPGRIKGAVGDLGGLLVAAGRAVISGLIKGIESGFGPLGSVLGKVGGFIKDHKGPLDYDLRLLIPAGQAIMQGLQSGLVSQLGSLRQVLTTITSSIAGAGGNLGDIGKYFAQILQDGDYLNDWLTHIPESMRKAVEQAGANLAAASGFGPGKYGADILGQQGLTNPWASPSAIAAGPPLLVQFVMPDGKVAAEYYVDAFAEALRLRDASLQ